LALTSRLLRQQRQKSAERQATLSDLVRSESA
jgi:hypothetical protein